MHAWQSLLFQDNLSHIYKEKPFWTLIQRLVVQYVAINHQVQKTKNKQMDVVMRRTMWSFAVQECPWMHHQSEFSILYCNSEHDNNLGKLWRQQIHKDEFSYRWVYWTQLTLAAGWRRSIQTTIKWGVWMYIWGSVFGWLRFLFFSRLKKRNVE